MFLVYVVIKELVSKVCGTVYTLNTLNTVTGMACFALLQSLENHFCLCTSQSTLEVLASIHNCCLQCSTLELNKVW